MPRTQIPNDAAERNPATAHMFIINPLSGQRMDNLFSTHPATENRIAALRTARGRDGPRQLRFASRRKPAARLGSGERTVGRTPQRSMGLMPSDTFPLRYNGRT